MSDNPKTRSAPNLIRRLLAILYDAFLLLALLFITTALMMILNNGEIQQGQTLSYLRFPVFMLVSFLFYGWFWTHGGQTLGMKTWKMRLLQANGKAVTWPVALVRFAVAIVSWSVFGLGFLWSLFDSRNRTWHDIASGSVLHDLRY